ncbi:MAG: sulfite exporter TauE/SafE family protein [Promethearchaeota archaeon]|nr:MAG: sulfite exporter TauE/SafE family protein [Candidatus Lokiarchaeota archaeon]
MFQELMELIWYIIIILILLGFLVGIVSSIAGIGGGVFFVPIMTLILLYPINKAIDTSTFIILISSGVAFAVYLKDKKIALKPTLIFTAFSILGSLTCTLLTFYFKFDNSLLKILFATTLIFAGLNMIRKALTFRKRTKNQDIEEEDDFSLMDHDYRSNLFKSIPLFFLAGFVANLLGIGGGVINTPALNIVLGYPIHNSTAISTGIIFFTAIFNTIIKSIYGEIDYIVGIFIAMGAVLGAAFGARISNRITKVHLQFLVAFILIILAIRMYF